MNKLKKALRVIVFICLIVLAGIGVGLSGGVPVSKIKINRDPEKDQTEMMEAEEQLNTIVKK